MDYHAPTDCQIIRKWLTKCADDSETANYISAHTKDCPKCHICIEKNGGCNHMQCYHCKYDFCWMCLGDWRSHGSEYYECSRYKENPNIAHESVHAQVLICDGRIGIKNYLRTLDGYLIDKGILMLPVEIITINKAKKMLIHRDSVCRVPQSFVLCPFLFIICTMSVISCKFSRFNNILTLNLILNIQLNISLSLLDDF